MFESLLGKSCFTASEQKKLLQSINEKSSTKITALSGQWIYYVHLHKPEGLPKVKSLLGLDATPTASESARDTADVYVTPRNISPWSSKATSIAHVCGMKEQVERIELGRVLHLELLDAGAIKTLDDIASFRDVIFDRMTENISLEFPASTSIFAEAERKPLGIVDILAEGCDPLATLQDYNKQMGLGLDQANMEYLVAEYQKLGRPPSDVELFMFAQVNSEHCRHHVFNSNWTIDGTKKDHSLFEMIKNTHKKSPAYTESAYSDNAAVLGGLEGNHWAPDYSTGNWALGKEVVMPLIKVETVSPCHPNRNAQAWDVALTVVCSTIILQPLALSPALPLVAVVRSETKVLWAEVRPRRPDCAASGSRTCSSQARPSLTLGKAMLAGRLTTPAPWISCWRPLLARPASTTRYGCLHGLCEVLANAAVCSSAARR